MTVQTEIRSGNLSIQSAGPGCTTMSQPIYCQGGRKSASLVQLSPDALPSQIRRQLLPCNPWPTFWDSDSLNFKCHGLDFKCHGHQLAPYRCNLGGGLVWDVVVQLSPGPSLLGHITSLLPVIGDFNNKHALSSITTTLPPAKMAKHLPSSSL